MEGNKDRTDEKKTIVVGPWGGNGGTDWDDGSYDGVREITVVYARCIDSITVVYDKNGKPVSAEKHGGGGGNNSAEDFSVLEMATVPGQLIWEIVKKNNCFLVKEFGNGTAGVKFSKEPNNLFNVHSYKYSGLANKKTVTIQPGKDQSVLFATTKTKKQNKPAHLLNKSLMKKEFSRMAKAVSNQVADNYYRPDLKKAALARLSVVNRSLKVAKSGVKKRNRQAA
ncbi:large ribosomal subunit protein eL28z-like isoform X1 [Primulina eburnea]|uniref:large ribosomal subunit protein eL28z-like isoform X1 n=2 Tax=Primulina eburnea TaxID=1245227 RepID=UPI003C6C341F